MFSIRIQNTNSARAIHWYCLQNTDVKGDVPKVRRDCAYSENWENELEYFKNENGSELLQFPHLCLVVFRVFAIAFPPWFSEQSLSTFISFVKMIWPMLVRRRHQVSDQAWNLFFVCGFSCVCVCVCVCACVCVCLIIQVVRLERFTIRIQLCMHVTFHDLKNTSHRCVSKLLATHRNA